MIPERNDILRLDELMSRKSGSINAINQWVALFVFVIFIFIYFRCDFDEISKGTELVSCVTVCFIVDYIQGSSL